MAVEVWPCVGGQGVAGCCGGCSAGEVIQIRELCLGLQLWLWSVPLAGVTMTEAEASGGTGAGGEVWGRVCHGAMKFVTVPVPHMVLPQGHYRDTQSDVRHELPHHRLHAQLERQREAHQHD